MIAAPLLKQPEKYKEGKVFIKDGYAVSESNVTRIGFKITQSYVSLTCDESRITIHGTGPVHHFRCSRRQVPKLLKIYSAYRFKLNKEEEQQIEELKNTTEGWFLFALWEVL